MCDNKIFIKTGLRPLGKPPMSIRIPKWRLGYRCLHSRLSRPNIFVVLLQYVKDLKKNKKIFFYRRKKINFFSDTTIRVGCTGVCTGAHVPNSGIWQFSQFCENAHSYPPSVKFVQKCAQIGQKVAFFGQKVATFFWKRCFFDFSSRA